MKIFQFQRVRQVSKSLKFSNIVQTQEENENDTNKIICDRKEVTGNRNYTETEYASVEDLLSVHRTA